MGSSPNQFKLESHSLKLGSLAPLTRAERKAVKIAEHEAYKAKRRQGFDEVSNTNEAIQLRKYRIRNLKFSMWREINYTGTSQVSMSEILFPGQTPEEYDPGEGIAVFSDLVVSRKTQVPYEYYDLPVCRMPTSRYKKDVQNLGTKLLGHARQRAPYEIYTLNDMPCTPLCRIVSRGEDQRRMKSMIKNLYRIHLELDGLPVMMRSQELNFAVRGFPLGFRLPKSFPNGNSGEFFLYNHLSFEITYYREDNGSVQITGFDVHPVSIDHMKASDHYDESASCANHNVVNEFETYLSLDASEILYSYDVVWKRNDNLFWADRWDVYCLSAIADLDRFQRFYNLMRGVVFLFIVACAILTWMITSLRNDLTSYTKHQKEEGESTTQNETGWISIHGDVFRPPVTTIICIGPSLLPSQMLLCVAVGSGSQIGLSCCLAIVLAISGVTQVMVMGQVLTSMIFSYAICGLIAGFWSSRIYKLCCHTTKDLTSIMDWRKNAIATAVTLPFVLGSIFVFSNIILGYASAATSVSIATMFDLFLVWGCISVPSVLTGAWIGNRMEVIKVPTETNEIARVVPKEEAPGYLKYGVPLLLGGFLPFITLSWELPRVMNALWHGTMYLDMDFLLVILTCSTVIASLSSVVLCYLQLFNEDHRWWWKSFANAGCTGLYLFLYSLWFALNRMELSGMLLPWVVYLTTMTMLSIAFGLFYGSVGFLSCLWFTRVIYGAIDGTRPNSEDEYLPLKNVI